MIKSVQLMLGFCVVLSMEKAFYGYFLAVIVSSLLLFAMQTRYEVVMHVHPENLTKISIGQSDNSFRISHDCES